MIYADTLFFSLLVGVLPAIVWLFFWLREDKKRPEPRGLIMLTFVFGMISVPLVIPIQKWSYFPANEILTFTLWATIEELFKFGAAYFAALRKRDDDEPIDPMIYMMTAALGFVAIENMLFILLPLLHNNFTETFITGNVRFVGANLLHTVSSAIIGIAMGLSFYKSKFAKQFYLVVGFLVAIILHTAFNFFIIKSATSTTLATLGFVWIAIVVVMLFFEKIKKVFPVDNI
jgi:RsiW-degrading membrane proteinase PrsW (M82 family)